MKKSNKALCPFKRVIKRSIGKSERGSITTQFHEYFKPCDAERCMAYNNGICKKLEINNKGGERA